MDNIDSPSGRFRIAISAWEARMSCWIETPTLLDQVTKETLLAFKDSNWSLEAARWLSDTVVELTLRKYPGGHLPVQIAATLDCVHRNAKIGETVVHSFAEIEPTLEHALTWRTDPHR
jgi:hypothetical protein